MNGDRLPRRQGLVLEVASQQGQLWQETLLGRYYRVTGPIMGRYLLANEVETVEEPIDPDEVLIRARSM